MPISTNHLTRVSKTLGRLVMAALIGTLGLWQPSLAAEFTCAGGDVACLIEAIKTANANGDANTIILEAGTYTLTAIDNDTNGPTGLPSITAGLTITGAGADTTMIERAASASRFRLLHVAATGVLTLEGLTLRGGDLGRQKYLWGGGIHNLGPLTITQSTLRNNTASYGGGISHGGTLTITDSTLSGNMADSGGGISVVGYSSLTIANSMLSGNVADSGGGISLFKSSLQITNGTVSDNVANSGRGIGGATASVTMQNTILARNSVPPTGVGPDCAAVFMTSQGHNLLGEPTGCDISLAASDLMGDPGLSAFVDDATPGRGHFPLLPASRAIEAGDDATCPPTDQLGQPRVGRCDIGAVEFQPAEGEVVAIRQAIFVDQLSVLAVVATSSAAPDAELFVTVPECLAQVPMRRITDRYLLVRTVPECGDLDGHTVTVTSSRGGSASAPLR